MRRLFLLSPVVLLGGPAVAPQSAERVFHLGELAVSVATLEYTRQVTLPELAKLGFEDGRNLIVEQRAGDADAIRGLALKLLETKPDAILAIGGDAIRAAMEATTTVPIVSFGSAPGGGGAPASLAPPSGNITGILILAPELDGKRLELLHEAVPGAKKIAALFVPWAPDRDASEHEMRKVAENAGLDLISFDAGRSEGYPGAFAAMRAAGAEALVITANANFNRDREMLAALALEAALPTICEWAEMARAGCLLGYGPSLQELRGRLAFYIANILRGTKPGDLPIEQPTRYKSAINLNTAKALGITIPPLTLSRADEVIE